MASVSSVLISCAPDIGISSVSRKQRTAAKHADNRNRPCEAEPGIVRRNEAGDVV